MTYFDLYKNANQALVDCNIDNPDFAALQLVLNAFGLSRTKYLLNRNETAPQDKTVDFIMKLGRVVSGEPLQYVVGKWEFMGLDFFVGKGVLIPRPETELLVENSIDIIKNIDNPVIIDLCSGSGCIAISLAKRFPNAKIYAVEYSDDALDYLIKNIQYHNIKNIKLVKYDVLKGYTNLFFEPFDLIVSNPPYVKTDDIQNLDNVVKFEPNMALDGGTNGLKFYKSIVENWSKFAKNNGSVAFECGDGQGVDILKMLYKEFFISEIKYDLSKIDRVVIGKRKI